MTRDPFTGFDIMKDGLTLCHQYRLTAEYGSEKFKLQLCNLQEQDKFLNTRGK
jgi:hypothetical protein